MSRKMDLNLLQPLDALLIERNVTRAAARLYSTQPALSAQLTRLRAMFDDPLLIPGSRGMTPTPRALEIAPRLSALINGLRSLLEPEEFDASTAEATILISGPDVMLNMPAPYFSDWAKTAPGIKLALLPLMRLSKPEIDTKMATGQLDLLITLRSEIPDGLHVHHLFSESFVCVARRDHPFGNRTMTTDDLCKLEHIEVSPLGGEFTSEIDTELHALGKTRKVMASLPSFTLAERILCHSDFVAIFPKTLARNSQDLLRVYELPVDLPVIELALGWHTRTHRSPPHRWLRERLFEAFREAINT
jgi:DNA-binding transcriptional LysR family regulator